MISMRKWKIVMSNFICLTLPLLLKQLFKLILLPHLFNPLYESLLLPLFELLLVHLLLLNHLMIVLDKKHLFLEFLLLLLQLQELSVLHLLQVLAQQFTLRSWTRKFSFAVWEDNALARSLT
jgi:ACR3 family arsenite efflux pump ArsB